VEASIIAHAPPAKGGAHRGEREPGRNIRLVIEIDDDDLATFPERLPDGEAHQTDERGRVHPERNLLGTTCIEKRRHLLARVLNSGIHGDALRVAPTALHVVLEQMGGYRIEDPLWHLRARSNSAVFLGKADQLGSIEAGKLADLVLLNKTLRRTSTTPSRSCLS
jgi:hypothetical protein